MTAEQLKVLIVGAGFGGLSAAIACARQGFAVTVLEQGSAESPHGDAIGFGANVLKVAYRWGVGAAMWDVAAHGCFFITKDYKSGQVLGFEDHSNTPERFGAPIAPGHRAMMIKFFVDQAKREGVQIRTHTKVASYAEDAPRPHVTTTDGERLEADVVLASDGIKSKAREVVLGFEDKPESSGYAVYRGALPATEILADPTCAHLIDENGRAWLGPDVHAIIASFDHCRWVSMAVTHKDPDGQAIESWNKTTDIKDVLDVIDGWDTALRAAVSKFETAIDWKLAWRDPLPTWVSTGGKIALLGDGAHPFLPTSIQGGAMAFEDGAALGLCLRLAGSDVPLALKVYQALRYDRVKSAQMSGQEQRKKWHKAHDDDGKFKEGDVSLSTADYYDHDVESDTLARFEQVARQFEPDFVLDAATKAHAERVVDLDKCTKPGEPLHADALPLFFQRPESDPTF